MINHPITGEQYKGYAITVWPRIGTPSFYSNAVKQTEYKTTGFGGMEGNTPAEAIAAAKRQVDSVT